MMLKKSVNTEWYFPKYALWNEIISVYPLTEIKLIISRIHENVEKQS